MFHAILNSESVSYCKPLQHAIRATSAEVTVVVKMSYGAERVNGNVIWWIPRLLSTLDKAYINVFNLLGPIHSKKLNYKTLELEYFK